VVHKTPLSVLLLCLACLIFEGYDALAYDATLPFVLTEREWGVTVAQAGILSSLTPIGGLTKRRFDPFRRPAPWLVER
jgi:AAHS family benzoate transporter-like MFS transporter